MSATKKRFSGRIKLFPACPRIKTAMTLPKVSMCNPSLFSSLDIGFLDEKAFRKWGALRWPHYRTWSKALDAAMPIVVAVVVMSIVVVMTFVAVLNIITILDIVTIMTIVPILTVVTIITVVTALVVRTVLAPMTDITSSQSFWTQTGY